MNEKILLSGYKGSVLFLCRINDTTFASAGNDNVVIVWDIEGNIIREFKAHRKWITSLASINDHTMASGSRDGVLYIWNVEGEIIKLFTEREPCIYNKIYDVLFITNITNLKDTIVYCEQEPFGAGTIKVRNISGETTDYKRVSAGCSVTCIVIIDIDTIVWSGNSKIQFYNINETDWSKRKGKTLSGHTSTVSCIAKIDKTHIISGSWDNTLRVWDIITGETIRVFTHTRSITQVITMSPSIFLSGCMISDWYQQWNNNTEEGQPLKEMGKDGCDCLIKLNSNHIVTSNSGSHIIKIYTLPEPKVEEKHEQKQETAPKPKRKPRTQKQIDAFERAREVRNQNIARRKKEKEEAKERKQALAYQKQKI